MHHVINFLIVLFVVFLGLEIDSFVGASQIFNQPS